VETLDYYDNYKDVASLRSNKAFSPWFFLIFPLAVVSKIVQYTLLPAKYFYDSNAILNIMASSPGLIFDSAGYSNAAVFSNVINIFGFSTLQQWSVFYAVVFNVVLFNVARKYKIRTFSAWIWFFGTCGVLNLYIFNLSKDIFQFVVFLIIYLILQSKKNMLAKIIMSVGVMFCWGLIFRLYYCLIALYIAMVYVLLQCFSRTKRLLFMMLLILSAFLVSIILIWLITPENYEILYTVKDLAGSARRFGSPDAETEMIDIIRNNGNPLILFINIFSLVVRLMLPIELPFIGFRIQYFIFMGYQFIITAYYLKTAVGVLHKQVNETQKVAFCVFTGFLLGSGLFEPGFGSWIRHESAIVFIMLLAFFKRRGDICKGVLGIASSEQK
jgi:hypothetical protein